MTQRLPGLVGLRVYQTVNKELDFYIFFEVIKKNPVTWNNFERHFARNFGKNGMLSSKKFCNEQFDMP